MKQLLRMIFLEQEIVPAAIVKPDGVSPRAGRQVIDRKRGNWLAIASDLLVDQFYDPVAIVGEPHIAFFVLQNVAVKPRRESARGVEDLLVSSLSQPNDLIFGYQPTIARSIEINIVDHQVVGRLITGWRWKKKDPALFQGFRVDQPDPVMGGGQQLVVRGIGQEQDIVVFFVIPQLPDT